MGENNFDPLELLLSAASELDKEAKIKSKEITKLNEDEFFLSKIATHELKVLETPPTKITNTSKNKILIQSTLNEKHNLETKKKKKINLSLIHTGDTDSSDDEANRDYTNSKYNECGREIKHLLSEEKPKSEIIEPSSTWKQKLSNTSLKFNSQLKQEDNIVNDPFFGMKISKPLISSAVLKERMAGRIAVSMAKVKQFVTTVAQNQDWVIAGVIVQKSNVRTSQNGSQYIIWTLSDLQTDLQTVSMFLFRNAYKELWKSSVGTVIGVLNPTVLENRDGSKHQATLSVDNHQKVMIFGESKDYGLCKSKKKDGEQCTAFVNTSKCSYCIYHIKQEYQKLSLRSELQSKFSGGGLQALRNKVLGKNEVFYAGKSYMAIPAKKNKKQTEKDNKRLLGLSKEGITTSEPVVRKNKKGIASSLETSRAQRIKDMQLLQKLNGSSDISFGLDSKINFSQSELSTNVTLEDSKKAALDVIAKLKSKSSTNNLVSTTNSNKNEVSCSTSLKDSKKSPLLKKNSNGSKESQDNSKKLFQDESPNKSNKINKPLCAVPKLTELNKDIELEPSGSKINAENTTQFIHKLNNPQKENESSSSKSNINIPNLDIESIVDVTKLKIFKNLKSQPAPKLTHSGDFTIDLSAPLKKKPDRAKMNALLWVQQNGPIKKTNPTGKEKSGVKRFLDSVEENEPKAKKSKLEEQAKVSQRFRKIMEMTSKNADLLEQRDLDEQEKYFNKLEMREKMEEKMMTTYKMQCKAVRCLNCKYTSFSAADRCKEEKHALKVFDATKRFFKCGNCTNRTVTLDIVPQFSCKQCGSSKWERTTMMKEKTAKIGEALSIRGGEQTFVNSVVTNANINLLVPED